MLKAFIIATTNHPCPKCKVPKGIYCSTLGGKQQKVPHAQRVRLLTAAEKESCKANQ